MKSNLDRYLGLIFHILKRPGMFAVNRVEDLHFIEFGFRQGMTDDKDDVNEFISDFQLFVNKYCNIKTKGKQGTYSWYLLIRLHSGNSDRQTLETIETLLTRYLEEKNIPKPQLFF